MSADPVPPILAAERLRKEYGGRTVLDVDKLDLRRGELLAALGPNGAGKSTLLRLLAMLEKPTRGVVRYQGRSGRAAERALRRESAAVFQRPHFWREPVAYNVGVGLRLRGVPAAEANRRVDRICQLLGIGHLLKTNVFSLSGGETQRVAIARALVLQPQILFLDEPTASLDTGARSELRDDLERVARQRAGSVFLITHDRAEAFYLADRIAVLEEGRIVQIGTPTELYENPADPYIARVTGAELTLRGRVERVDGRTLTVNIGNTRLLAVGDAGEGTTVKIAYRPEDLILSHPEASAGELSTRNHFFATILERRDLGGLVRLRLVAPTELVAVVTKSAADQLGLVAGARVSVRVKATALHAFPAGRGSELDPPEGATRPDPEDASAEKLPDPSLAVVEDRLELPADDQSVRQGSE